MAFICIRQFEINLRILKILAYKYNKTFKHKNILNNTNLAFGYFIACALFFYFFTNPEHFSV